MGGSKGLPKSARNLLECPVCLELAWPPKKIYQCREGHIICEECKGNPALKVCPMCRIPLANNLTSRNRQLEELARALKEEEEGCSSPSAPPLPYLPPSSPSPPPLTLRLAQPQQRRQQRRKNMRCRRELEEGGLMGS